MSVLCERYILAESRKGFLLVNTSSPFGFTSLPNIPPSPATKSIADACVFPFPPYPDETSSGLSFPKIIKAEDLFITF